MTGASSAFPMDEFVLDLANKNINLNDALLAYLSTTDLARLGKVLARLERVRALDAKAISISSKRSKTRKQVEGQQSKLVGLLMERMIAVLLDGCKQVMEFDGNIRTTTAEVDFLLRMTGLSRVVPMLQDASTHILGEAKCYSSGLKTEWINELVGLMAFHGTKHSILFVASPSKKLQTAHRFALQGHSLQGNYVVPFGMAQIKKIMAGSNFLKVLGDQFVDMRSGSNVLAI